MKIKTEQHAREHAIKHLGKDTLVVSENGDIHANCNVDTVCTEHEQHNENFFILKGERTKKVKSKGNDL